MADKKMIILHPGAEVRSDEHYLAEVPTEAVAVGESDDRSILGFIDNTKFGCGQMFEIVGQSLVRQRLIDRYDVYRKQNMSLTAPPEAVNQLASRSRWAITGLGD